MLLSMFCGLKNNKSSQPRVAAAESLSGFKEVHASPYFKPHTVILHPGEVL